MSDETEMGGVSAGDSELSFDPLYKTTEEAYQTGVARGRAEERRLTAETLPKLISEIYASLSQLMKEEEPKPLQVFLGEGKVTHTLRVPVHFLKELARSVPKSQAPYTGMTLFLQPVPEPKPMGLRGYEESAASPPQDMAMDVPDPMAAENPTITDVVQDAEPPTLPPILASSQSVTHGMHGIPVAQSLPFVLCQHEWEFQSVVTSEGRLYKCPVCSAYKLGDKILAQVAEPTTSTLVSQESQPYAGTPATTLAASPSEKDGSSDEVRPREHTESDGGIELLGFANP